MKQDIFQDIQAVYWKTDKFRPYYKNPRKNDHAVNRVAAAIAEYGFKVPVVAVEENGAIEVIDGHLRLKAALKLNMEELPIIDASHLSPEDRKALRISMNRMAELAEWDGELLHLEFEELSNMGVDLGLTGFDTAELNELFWNEGVTDKDKDSTEPRIKTSGGESGTLYKKFGMPPFTILDQNNEQWKLRREQWKETLGE